MAVPATMSARAKNISSAALLALFTALAAGSYETDSGASKVASEPSSYTLTAKQLYDEYDANKVAAEAKYDSKIVTVTGTIQSIGKDVADNAYIVIDGMGLDGVQCLFPEGQESAISQLSKGQEIVAKGKVDGQAIGNIIVRNCTLQ